MAMRSYYFTFALFTFALAAFVLPGCVSDNTVGLDDDTGDDDTADDPVDADGDGYTEDVDCDDSDPSVHPNSKELCDGVDTDCDGEIPDDELDEDSDGLMGCEGDCDDSDPEIYPGAEEVEDGLDNDCDGSVDEGTSPDADGDGYSADVDCNDEDATVYPGADEFCNEVDDDCDGVVDDDVIDAPTWYADGDLDGFGNPDSTAVGCSQPSGFVADNTDCDDGEATVYPGAEEVCDELDNDCDGETDEDAADVATWYEDLDGDGYGNPDVTSEACYEPSGFVSNADDCDDADAATYPGADEYCDEVDNDCDGTVDDSAIDVSTWYEDLDGDLFGNPDVTTTACSEPEGFVADNTDCDDGEATVYPGAEEVCDELDNDCDGETDEDAADVATWYEDLDGDGYGDAANFVYSCTQPEGYIADSTDCDDGDADVHPENTEVTCDGVDNDCDAGTEDDPADGDGDGVSMCDGDCDDTNPDIYPGAEELQDGVDTDCDGVLDPTSCTYVHLVDMCDENTYTCFTAAACVHATTTSSVWVDGIGYVADGEAYEASLPEGTSLNVLRQTDGSWFEVYTVDVETDLGACAECALNGFAEAYWHGEVY